MPYKVPPPTLPGILIDADQAPQSKAIPKAPPPNPVPTPTYPRLNIPEATHERWLHSRRPEATLKSKAQPPLPPGKPPPPLPKGPPPTPFQPPLPEGPPPKAEPGLASGSTKLPGQHWEKVDQESTPKMVVNEKFDWFWQNYHSEGNWQVEERKAQRRWYPKPPPAKDEIKEK